MARYSICIFKKIITFFQRKVRTTIDKSTEYNQYTLCTPITHNNDLYVLETKKLLFRVAKLFLNLRHSVDKLP